MGFPYGAAKFFGSRTELCFFDRLLENRSEKTHALSNLMQIDSLDEAAFVTYIIDR